jgi:hypothetical protein
MASDPDIAKQLDEHLRSPRQVWLLGAGVSFDAGIPLMIPLTEQIYKRMDASTEPNKDTAIEVISFIRNELSPNSHIEHVLSHLADIVALAERAKDTSFAIGAKRISKMDLQKIHHQILGFIRDILRWGYKPEAGGVPEQIGTSETPIVTVDSHRRFIRALYGGRAGVDNFRAPVQLITTNYDTLIEDALSLERQPYADGFTGGAVAYWSEEVFNTGNANRGLKAFVTKLHGSIDWHSAANENGYIFRVRHNELYPDRTADNSSVVIYPQSTKYTASRLNPFGCMFQHFRNLMAVGNQQDLFICGYSFGDDHINADIEQLLVPEHSRMTIIAFTRETAAGLPLALERWRQTSAGPRVFIVTEKGLYRGKSGPHFPAVGGVRDWWTFSGVTQLLEEGLPPDVVALIP